MNLLLLGLTYAFYISGISILVFIVVFKVVNKFERKSVFKRHNKNNLSTLYKKVLESQANVFQDSKLKEKLRIIGNPFGLNPISFRLAQLSLMLFWLFVFIVMFLYQIKFSFYVDKKSLIQMLLLSVTLPILMELLLLGLISLRKKQLRIELSRFAYRIHICFNEGMDLREVIIRASRTLNILKPHIDAMCTRWGYNQEEAIKRFGDNVAIPEVKPLVNILLSIKKTKKENVQSLITEQVNNIDSIIDYINKNRIETTSLGSVFLSFIPFSAILLLMISPWLYQLMDMLNTMF